jgi:aspartyl-tRNA(Asn)/glutamyl-tRNA(Gln) amidotransferase subunit A
VNDPTALTLRAAAAAIARGELRAEALVEACLDRIERLQPKLNCFIRVTADAAREQARAADRAVKAGQRLGPLHGVPLAHKDMFYRAGEVCSCGSKIRAAFVPDHTATVLARFDAAGALELGRLNLAEFALGPTGHNDHFGRCRNPWHPEHITGGSSSGSGAAVAAGLAFGALGSDTGGSVRLPAAVCGIAGIKPTLGRVSRYGAMPLSQSLDCIGVLARSVGDCARLLSVIAGADDRDGMSSRQPVEDYERGLEDAAGFGALAGVTIGVPDRYYYDGVDPEVAELLAASRALLEKRGARIVDVPVGDHGMINDLAGAVVMAEGAALHLPWLRERPQDLRALAQYFLEEFRARNNFRAKTLDDGVFAVFENYAWPGNARELKNAIERMAILTQGDRLTVESVPVEIRVPRESAERDHILRALEETVTRSRAATTASSHTDAEHNIQ